MTYWEAKAAGFHVPPLPSETGMRVCTADDLDNPGFRSPEAVAKALAEYEARWGESGGPGDCQVDPKTMQYVIFPPGHGPGSIFTEDG